MIMDIYCSNIKNITFPLNIPFSDIDLCYNRFEICWKSETNLGLKFLFRLKFSALNSRKLPGTFASLSSCKYVFGGDMAYSWTNSYYLDILK